MAGWTGASLIPTSLVRNVVNPKPPAGALTPEQKLKLSGGVTRHALSSSAPAPTIITPAATNVGSATTSPATNMPPFLQGGDNQNLPTDVASLLQQLLESGALGQQKQDPGLVQAQTILAQQQAMQVARGNEAARRQEGNAAAMGYLQSQLRDASQYTTGSVGNILKQRYEDRAKVLQNQGELNWLNMPSSSFSVPKKSGWTGPAMPGTWGL